MEGRRQHVFLWTHRFAVLTACTTFLLVIAGGVVTSTGSGLSVPDWRWGDTAEMPGIRPTRRLAALTSA